MKSANPPERTDLTKPKKALVRFHKGGKLVKIEFFEMRIEIDGIIRIIT